jgi:hypothetical protein
MTFDRRFPGVSGTRRTLPVDVGCRVWSGKQAPTGRATKAQGIALGTVAMGENKP